MSTKKNKAEPKITHERVRFHTDAGKWVTTNHNDQKVIEFDYGVMTNVTFHTKEVVKKVAGGCGSSSTEHTIIGIAEGDLQIDTKGSALGYKNLAFKDGHFVNNAGDIITRCSSLRFMSSRKALYKP